MFKQIIIVKLKKFKLNEELSRPSTRLLTKSMRTLLILVFVYGPNQFYTACSISEKRPIIDLRMR